MYRRAWLVVTLVALAGCLDLSTDPDEVVAIRFDELPWPSIVAGDTLRDSTGSVAPLTAQLFDAEGDPVDGTVEFLSQDAKLTVAGDGRVAAPDTATGVARVLASTAGIQSIVRQLEIVAAPDSLATDGAVTPFTWVVPDDPAENTSSPLAVRVLDVTDDDTTGVRAWVVGFDLLVNDAIVPKGDTSHVYLVNDAGRVSYADTTDTQGRASRRLRLKIGVGLTAPDSAVIVVRASYKGQPLAGSPRTLVLPIRTR